MIVDLSPVFQMCQEASQLKVLLGYIDEKKFIQDLLVSPDVYECHELYERIYEICGNEFNQRTLSVLTDEIDAIYKQLFNRVSNATKVRYSDEPYIFHKWLNDQTAIIGSVKPVQATSQVPVRNDRRDCRLNGPLPWEPDF